MTVPPGHVLTWRQRKVLSAIRDSVQKRGYPPSLREIGEAVGLASTSGVRYQLLALQGKGYLRRDAGQSRAVELLPVMREAQEPPPEPGADEGYEPFIASAGWTEDTSVRFVPESAVEQAVAAERDRWLPVLRAASDHITHLDNELWNRASASALCCAALERAIADLIGAPPADQEKGPGACGFACDSSCPDCHGYQVRP